jgi:hypothetical protein
MKTQINLMEALEAKAGGPVAASRVIGVTYVTWYRWKTGRREMSDKMIRFLELLVEKEGAAS